MRIKNELKSPLNGKVERKHSCRHCRHHHYGGGGGGGSGGNGGKDNFSNSPFANHRITDIGSDDGSRGAVPNESIRKMKKSNLLIIHHEQSTILMSVCFRNENTNHLRVVIQQIL